MRVIKIWLAIALVLTIVIIVNAIVSTPKPSVTAASAPSASPGKTSADDALLAKRVAKFGARPVQSEWDGSYDAVKTFLIRGANDPDSIKFEGCGNVMVDESKGWLVGCSYRGKNKFGGLVKNFNWFIVKNGQVIEMAPQDEYTLKPAR